MGIGTTAASVARLPLNVGRNILKRGSNLIGNVGKRTNNTLRKIRRTTLKGGAKRTNRNRKNKNRSNKNRSNKNRNRH